MIDPDEEVALAEKALASGDSAHAFAHAARALAQTIGEDTHLRLIRRIAPTAEKLNAVSSPSESSDHLLTARGVALHLIGRDNEALPLLAEVAAFRSDAPFESWLAPWIRDAVTVLDGSGFANYLFTTTETNVGRVALRAAETAYAKRLATVVDALLARQDTGTDATTLALASSVYRRAGRGDDAIHAAQRSIAVHESYFGYTSLALSERAKGNFEAARAAFATALTLQPDATHVVAAEQGRIAWDAGDLATAREHYETFQESADPELAVGLAWLRHAAPRKKPTGFGATFKRWFASTPKGPTAEKGESFEKQVGRALVTDDAVLLPCPWIGWLPGSTDATINTGRQILGSDMVGISMSVSHLEAPSVRLAMAMLTGSTSPSDADYTASEVPQPDIREPRVEVPFVLWSYDGQVPTQALPPPSASVANAVRDLANTPFYLPRWLSHAAEIGPALGPERAEELCAAMIHPSPTPAEVEPWDWLQQTQLASALLLSRVDTGWDHSERKRCLVSIVRGPLDWAIDAAVVALVELALDEPQFLPEIRTELEQLWVAKPTSGHVCWAEAFACAYPRLPSVSKHWVAQCDQWLNPSEQQNYQH